MPKTYKCAARIEYDVTVEAQSWEEAKNRVIFALEEGVENGEIDITALQSDSYPQLVGVLRLDDGRYHLHGLNNFAHEAHGDAMERGEWECRSPSDQLQACRCFVEQAIQEGERAYPPGYVYSGPEGKPCGMPFALADCLLHLLGYCAHEGIDIEGYLAAKKRYDKSHYEYEKERKYRCSIL